MKIYLVPLLYGRMRLPLLEFVVADNEDQAQQLVRDWAPGEVEFKKAPEPVGEAYKSEARVLR